MKIKRENEQCISTQTMHFINILCFVLREKVLCSGMLTDIWYTKWKLLQSREKYSREGDPQAGRTRDKGSSEFFKVCRFSVVWLLLEVRKRGLSFSPLSPAPYVCHLASQQYLLTNEWCSIFTKILVTIH